MPKEEITVLCEPPDVGAGHQTHLLEKKYMLRNAKPTPLPGLDDSYKVMIHHKVLVMYHGGTIS